MTAKISALPDAGALTGAEQVEVNDSGTSRRTTTQGIADLSGFPYQVGGGTFTDDPSLAAVAWGYADPTSTIVASGQSAFAFGRAANAGAITASSYGSVAFGYAYGTGTLTVSGWAALAFGYAGNGGSVVGAGANGLTFGGANATGVILNNNDCSFAFGYAGNGGLISCNGGLATFAGGNAGNEDIVATADGAFQWAPGTNDVAQSLRVGTGPWLMGAGLPGAPANGQIWVASSKVSMRSDSVTWTFDQSAHIADADLTDVHTKFNTLLDALELVGVLAS